MGVYRMSTEIFRFFSYFRLGQPTVKESIKLPALTNSIYNLIFPQRFIIFIVQMTVRSSSPTDNRSCFRYDCRLHLQNLTEWEATPSSSSVHLTEEEAEIEALCDQERYADLEKDQLEEQVYKG